jgi:hypothetical protein
MKIAVDGHLMENPIDTKISVDLEEIDLPNTGSRGGGKWKKATRANAINLEFNNTDFHTYIVERIMKADATALVTASQTDEELTALAGKIVPTAFAIDNDTGVTNTMASNAGTWAATTAYVVGDWLLDSNTHMQKCTTAGTSDASEPTWKTDGTTVTDGTAVWTDMGLFTATDYTAYTVGVHFGSDFPEGAPVKFTYESRAGDVVELATNTTRKSEILIDGLNEEDNTPVSGRFYIVDLSTSELPLNPENQYAQSPVVGSVLVDSTIATNKSSFGYLFYGSEKIV